MVFERASACLVQRKHGFEGHSGGAAPRGAEGGEIAGGLGADELAEREGLIGDLDVAGVQKFIAEEYAFWAPLARDAGLKVQ